jgi:exonuclease VII large subunit
MSLTGWAKISNTFLEIDMNSNSLSKKMLLCLCFASALITAAPVSSIRAEEFSSIDALIEFLILTELESEASGTSSSSSKEDCDTLKRQIESREASIARLQQKIQDHMDERIKFEEARQNLLAYINKHCSPPPARNPAAQKTCRIKKGELEAANSQIAIHQEYIDSYTRQLNNDLKKLAELQAKYASQCLDNAGAA